MNVTRRSTRHPRRAEGLTRPVAQAGPDRRPSADRGCSLRNRRLAATMLITLSAASVVGAQPPAASVNVSRVVVREVTSRQTFLGSVTAPRRATIGSAVDGRVELVHVDDGDIVKLVEETRVVDDQPQQVQVGQPLAQLRTKTISIQVAAAQAELSLAKHELAQLETSLPEQIAQAESKVLAAEALRQYARTRHDRVDSLYKRGSTVSREQLEEALSQLVAAEQNYLGAESALKELSDTRQVRVAQANSRVLVRQEEVNRLEDMRSKYTIRAPFEGVVVSKLTEVGSWVTKGDPIAEIVELDPAEITVAVPEIYIAQLQMALTEDTNAPAEIDVRLDAMPGQSFSGSFHRVVPQADLRSRTFPLQIRIANPRRPSGYLLKPGMLARVTLPIGGARQVTLVPKDALVLSGAQTTVFVVSPAGEGFTARPLTVETGIAVGALMEVRGDLKAGDRIVVEGNERLRPGPVKVLKEIAAE